MDVNAEELLLKSGLALLVGTIIGELDAFLKTHNKNTTIKSLEY